MIAVIAMRGSWHSTFVDPGLLSSYVLASVFLAAWPWQLAMADVLSLRPSSTLTRAHRESKTIPGEIARCPRHSPSELLGVLGGPGRMKIDMI